jgi:hypothetical protein
MQRAGHILAFSNDSGEGTRFIRARAPRSLLQALGGEKKQYLLLPRVDNRDARACEIILVSRDQA